MGKYPDNYVEELIDYMDVLGIDSDFPPDVAEAVAELVDRQKNLLTVEEAEASLPPWSVLQEQGECDDYAVVIDGKLWWIEIGSRVLHTDGLNGHNRTRYFRTVASMIPPA